MTDFIRPEFTPGKYHKLLFEWAARCSVPASGGLDLR